MIYWTDEQLIAHNIDKRKLQAALRKLNEAGEVLEKMGVVIFGGTGFGTLRYLEHMSSSQIIASLKGMYDGGDGGDEFEEDICTICGTFEVLSKEESDGHRNQAQIQRY